MEICGPYPGQLQHGGSPLGPRLLADVIDRTSIEIMRLWIRIKVLGTEIKGHMWEPQSLGPEREPSPKNILVSVRAHHPAEVCLPPASKRSSPLPLWEPTHNNLTASPNHPYWRKVPGLLLHFHLLFQFPQSSCTTYGNEVEWAVEFHHVPSLSHCLKNFKPSCLKSNIPITN